MTPQNPSLSDYGGPDCTGPDLTEHEETTLDPAVVAALYTEHVEELRWFVFGVLHNADQATEVLQNTFAKAIEVGSTARQESLKGWLFRVAFHEAMALRRRQGVEQRGARNLASMPVQQTETPAEQLCRWETVVQVRSALEELPSEQCQVVKMRIYEQKKFATIASELGLPLGTVLSRMQAALGKLRKKLAE
jgi:RNA polymerase sigma-70 factor (ECF subfamily)